ncbi:MAG: hypothetical protein ACR2NM_16385, partial [Bythopirellula sp.]
YPPAYFYGDGNVDVDDLPPWQNSYGCGATADTDGDLDSDGNDFLTWQQQNSLTLAIERSADFDDDADVDGQDFLAMQRGFADNAQGGDFLSAWQSQYGPGSALATRPEPRAPVASELPISAALIDAAIAFAQSEQHGALTADAEIVDAPVSLEPVDIAHQWSSELASSSKPAAASKPVGQTAADAEETAQQLEETALDQALVEFSAV